MERSKKKFSESAKKVIEIRRVLCDNSNNKLAEKLGLSPQTVSNLTAGLRGIGRSTAEKILAAFPEISRSWLLADEGPMLVTEGNGNAITQVGGNVGGNITTSTRDERLLSVIEAQQREREKLLEDQRAERATLEAIIMQLTQKQ